VSTSYPQQPGQGQGWGNQPPQGYGPQPPQGYGPQQPAPKKGGAGKIIGFGCLGFVAVIILIVIIAVAAGGSGSDTSSGSGGSTSTASTPADKGQPPAKTQSTVEAFKAYVRKNGTANEKAAVKHVNKIQGGEENNNILDSADVYTTLTGDMFSGDQASGKLIASAFADFQKSRGLGSKNGLVTVYNAGGDILSNGNY
jgi:hypothetical protein